jgi:hypothetical protein
LSWDGGFFWNRIAPYRDKKELSVSFVAAIIIDTIGTHKF